MPRSKEKEKGISVRAREAVVKVCLLAVYSDGLFSWWMREPLFFLINYFPNVPDEFLELQLLGSNGPVRLAQPGPVWCRAVRHSWAIYF